MTVACMVDTRSKVSARP